MTGEKPGAGADRTNPARSSEPVARPGAAESSRRLYDFCLWPYEPLGDPDCGRPFSDLLEFTFGLSSAPEALAALSRRCVDAFGPNATVWGVKWNGSELSWELYFYDYARLARRVTIASVLDAVGAPAWRSPGRLEHVPYFMCSVEVDGSGRVVPGIDVYVGTPGSEVSAGLCYACDESGASLKNLYHFFDARRQDREILDKLGCSMHLPPDPRPLGEILWPRTRNCQTLVLANKRACDGIYYSRVNVVQTLWFLGRIGYPMPLREHLQAHRGDYAHMLFDLGTDYRCSDGQLDFFRGAFYGVV